MYLFQVGNTGDLSFTPTLDLYVIRFMPVLLLIPVLSRAILVSAAQISPERKIQGNTALTKLSSGFQWQIVCSSIQKGERNTFADLFLSSTITVGPQLCLGVSLCKQVLPSVCRV